jgi:hypothetical protein
MTAILAVLLLQKAVRDPFERKLAFVHFSEAMKGSNCLSFYLQYMVY